MQAVQAARDWCAEWHNAVEKAGPLAATPFVLVLDLDDTLMPGGHLYEVWEEAMQKQEHAKVRGVAMGTCKPKNESECVQHIANRLAPVLEKHGCVRPGLRGLLTTLLQSGRVSHVVLCTSASNHTGYVDWATAALEAWWALPARQLDGARARGDSCGEEETKAMGDGDRDRDGDGDAWGRGAMGTPPGAGAGSAGSAAAHAVVDVITGMPLFDAVVHRETMDAWFTPHERSTMLPGTVKDMSRLRAHLQLRGRALVVIDDIPERVLDSEPTVEGGPTVVLEMPPYSVDVVWAAVARDAGILLTSDVGYLRLTRQSFGRPLAMLASDTACYLLRAFLARSTLLLGTAAATGGTVDVCAADVCAGFVRTCNHPVTHVKI